MKQCYEAFTSGQSPELPGLPVQYAEYAQWQREYLSGDVLSDEVRYWKEKLAGAPTILDLPTDHRRPSTPSWQGAAEHLVFDRDKFAKLKAFANQEGSTLFMESMTAFQGWLWSYTMQKSIPVGPPTAGRSLLVAENLIDFFVHTL